MRRGAPLRRGSTRMAQRSAKTIEQQPIRDEVRATTRARADGLCQAIELIPEIKCSGPATDTHETEGRGVNPGAHLDAEGTLYLCRGHHAWLGSNRTLAYERGLLQRSTFELRGAARRIR